MDKIRWGIIGCGDVCEVKSGPAFYKCQHSELAAVMRRDAAKAADFAARHNVYRWYTNADELINDPNVDIVYVATPPSTHADYTIRALNAGKPVYVEKPMALNYEECLLMNKAATDNNLPLWVAFYRRSLPYFLKIKELIDRGSIGNIRTVQTLFLRPPGDEDREGNWRVDKDISGGGYFNDMAPHTIDILIFLLGDIVDAKGIANNVAGLYQTEDVVSASFIFESGVVGSGLWNYVSSSSTNTDITEIHGDNGVIRFATFAFTPIELETESGIEYFDVPKPQHIQQPMIQGIVNELRGDGRVSSTGKTGMRANWVMEKILTTA
ncbi:MAG: Gfo/Idh/MocA family oxidoreductase [Tannerella sp.]|jgi:predicted dehydrogenase|nr:Gfo/Idh/MocA family oxidoreductase [Tannerella sp.]